jgi:proline iminopeptidase
MSENYINSNGVRIWTVVQGSGVPFLLCNGGPGCCDYLGPVAAMITDVAKVIRFEQRGCGRSEAVGPYDLETCLADLESIREHYGIDQWIVGGHSWGPDLAIAYAVTYPQRVLGIVGISGGVLHKDRAWSEQYHRLKDTVGETNPEFLYPPNMDVNRDINASWSEFVRKPKLLREVADLDVPALFIYGEKDIRPGWPVEQTANLLGRGRFVLIKDAPHVIWLSHGAAMEDHLRRFVMEIGREKSGEQITAADA